MKLSKEQAKDLLPRLLKTSKSQQINFPSLLFSKNGEAPGVNTQALCTEADPIKQFWQFDLYWLTIKIATVVAEVQNGNDLIVDIL